MKSKQAWIIKKIKAQSAAAATIKANAASANTMDCIPISTLAPMVQKWLSKPTTVLKTAQTSNGYCISTETMPSVLLLNIKRELTVRPLMSRGGGKAPSLAALTDSYAIFTEVGKNLYLPKFYGQFLFGAPLQKQAELCTNIAPLHPDVLFDYTKATLRLHQQEITQIYLEAVGLTAATDGGVVSSGGGGLIKLPCGFGKTVTAIHLIPKIGVRTLILVHKDFLANQWKSEINKYLPAARIGHIQGSIVNVENCDIIIGMLQSISVKEYAPSVFASIGLLIVDECHHIASRVFSQALIKIAPKYTLGLSARFERKDETHHVFLKFLGPLLYQKERDGSEDNLIVRRVDYACSNFADRATYESMITNKKTGDLMVAAMISKICDYLPRINFVLQVIVSTMYENPHRQILVLSQRKGLLRHLFLKLTTFFNDPAVVSANLFARDKTSNTSDPVDIGYYMGGIKQAVLDINKSKRIILGTYSMSSEALDIPTLNTLIMATPMSSVEQSVGRILRAKNPLASPLLIDIVDSHSNFQGQWRKRYKFYHGLDYPVYKFHSSDYFNGGSVFSLLPTASVSAARVNMIPPSHPCLLPPSRLTDNVFGMAMDDGVTDDGATDDEDVTELSSSESSSSYNTDGESDIEEEYEHDDQQQGSVITPSDAVDVGTKRKQAATALRLTL